MELGTLAGYAPADGSIDRIADDRGVCSRPIDLVHLARYTLGNKTFEREILDLFVGQSQSTLVKLEASATDKDWKDHAHALLGSARAVGAKRVADRVLVAQRLVEPGTNPDRKRVLAGIAAELETANLYIRDLFPDE
jgi:HPt (histidine-containing phosphotransfer) domain-containing protein